MADTQSKSGTDATDAEAGQRPLRSRAWFDNPGMTALYLERYLNYGLSIEELQGDGPIIGIAQSGSDLVPCNRHHLVLAERVKASIRDAGGIPIEFPTYPIQETGKRPPAALIRAGVHALPCIGDGRQSGTSGSPSILNAAPEAAVGGGLALVRTGDRVRIDLKARTADMLVDDAEIGARRAAPVGHEGDIAPASQTPWQEIQRGITGQFDTGAVLEPAVKYQRIAQTKGLPRDSH